MDLTCEVKWCGRFADSGIYCKMHCTRNYRHGSPTPMVDCFGCLNRFEFTYPGTTFDKQGNGPQKHWCVECSNLIEKHKVWLKPVNHAHILHFYHLTKIDYLKILISQSFSCGLCNRQGKKLVVDHDHECCSSNKSCGKCIRGLVCYDCNIFLGRIDTIPDIYQKALVYKESHRVSA